MTDYQKRENMEKRLYKLIAAGKYQEAERLQKMIVNFDVELLKKQLNQGRAEQ